MTMVRRAMLKTVAGAALAAPFVRRAEAATSTVAVAGMGDGGAKLPTIKPSQPSYRDGNNFRWCDAFDSVAEFPPRSTTFGAPHPLCSGQRPNCGTELKSE